MKKEYDRVWNIALGLLAKRNHTVFELERKLLKRGFKKIIVEQILFECNRLNFLDDKNSGRSYLNELIRRGYGPHRIRHEMGRKGLEDQLIDELFLEENIWEIESNLCRKVLYRKIKTFSGKRDLKKTKEYLFRFLLSRGFSKSLIIELLNELYMDSH